MTGQESNKLPSKVDLTEKLIQRLRSTPERIQQVLAKGQGRQDCCVAFVEMRDGCYRGTWGNGSMRFLHCVCKMIDEGTPEIGTTMVSANRAMKGWGTCEEELWPSNVDLSKSEFEDWKNIPKEAWENAKQKRTQANKRMATSSPYVTTKSNGVDFRLFTHYFNLLVGKDKQCELFMIDSEFETVAWATLRAYVSSNRIVLEDIFVKPEFRGKHIGMTLLNNIEQLSCRETPFSDLNQEIVAPISIPDAGPNRYNITRNFFLANGYEWKNDSPIRRSSISWSIFAAIKKIDCA